MSFASVPSRYRPLSLNCFFYTLLVLLSSIYLLSTNVIHVHGHVSSCSYHYNLENILNMYRNPVFSKKSCFKNNQTETKLNLYQRGMYLKEKEMLREIEGKGKVFKVHKSLINCRGGSSTSPSSSVSSVRTTFKGISPSLPSSSFSSSSKGYSSLSSKSKRNLNSVQVFQSNTDTDTSNKIGKTVQKLSMRNSRVGFIRKVYTILSMQLLLTAFVSYVFMTHGKKIPYNIMMNPNYSWVLPASFVTSLASLFALGGELRFKVPYNFALLSLFTFSQSISVATIVSFYKVKQVLLALAQTGTAVLGLTLYAFQPNPKYDLTPFGSSLFLALTIFMMTTLMGIFFPKVAMNEKILSGVGAFIFGLFLIYDTQLIVGGKHKKGQISTKDYIMGSVALYMDIINIFLYILRLLGQGQNDD